VNLVGEIIFEVQKGKLKIPIVIKSAGKNKQKIKGKREFSRKIEFRENRFWFSV